jgi:hypothetical protein
MRERKLLETTLVPQKSLSSAHKKFLSAAVFFPYSLFHISFFKVFLFATLVGGLFKLSIENIN